VRRTASGTRGLLQRLDSTTAIVAVLYSMAATQVACASDTPSSPVGKYVMVRSTEIGYSVCREFAQNLNESANKPFTHCQSHMSSKFERFERPKWEEHPVDLTLAERMVKRNLADSAPDKARTVWNEWLDKTKSVRSNSQLRMWVLRTDIDGNGAPDTIYRMNYGTSAKVVSVDKKEDSLDHCDYTNNSFLAVGTSDFARSFNMSRDVGDLIYDARSKRYFLVAWSSYPATGSGLWGNNLPEVRAGAKGGIALYELDASWGPVAICNIQWVAR